MPRPMEFDQTFRFIFKVLRLIGYSSYLTSYPDTFLGRLKSNAVFAVCFVMLGYCVFGQAINIVLLMTGYRRTDQIIEEVAIQVSCTGFCIIGLAKMYSLMYNRDTLYGLIKDFRVKWNADRLTEKDRLIRDRKLRPAVTISTVAAVGNIVMVSAFNFQPVVEMVSARMATGEWAKLFPYVIWFPFNSTSGPIYYILYLFEIYSGVIVCVGTAGFNSIFCLLSSHLSMQLILVRSWIESSVKAKDGNAGKSRENLRRIIEYHQDLLRFKDALQEIFSTTLFLNFAASSVLMCMQLYLITTAGYALMIKFTLFMQCILLEIFILCYYGEEIVVHSSSIANGAYNSNWYLSGSSKQNPRYGKSLILVIQRAQRPMILTAWKFWPLTIGTFSAILQTSWSYFTLLRTVMH
ncbi:odorant receptor 4-like [Armigeres subalbatus]|uniref:odorant receptor 4-like n=1 Tax=Armigeres subalbatus TaxID=124917 RepID=UPI002ED4D481